MHICIARITCNRHGAPFTGGRHSRATNAPSTVAWPCPPRRLPVTCRRPSPIPQLWRRRGARRGGGL